jgi:hypothetical protein
VVFHVSLLDGPVANIGKLKTHAMIPRRSKAIENH